MKRTILPFAVIAVTLLGAGCYQTVVYDSETVPDYTPVAYDHEWHHGFISGLVEFSDPAPLEEVCPQGWSEIESHTSFLNGLVNFMVPIYTPQTISVTCRVEGVAYRVELNGEGEITHKARAE